jgi:undecaprenyl-diphosphatase
MDLIQIVILAVEQGLTEFLPISSSAHLILTPHLLGYADQGLAFDVAVHFGSLLAVIGYFRRDLRVMIGDFFASLSGGGATPNSRLAWAVIIGTIPVGLSGLALKGLAEQELRTALVIAASTIGFGILLLVADLTGRRCRDEHSLTWRDALIVGLFQALAVVPGTSRSGITMTGGLLLGLTREAASRFSFLLAIPTIALSGGLVTLDLVQSSRPVDWGALALGSALSLVTAYLCIHYFLSFIERVSMLPFVIYRLLLGSLILAIVLIP